MSRPRTRASGERRAKPDVAEKVEKFLEHETEEYSARRNNHDDDEDEDEEENDDNDDDDDEDDVDASPRVSYPRTRRRWTISEELSRAAGREDSPTPASAASEPRRRRKSTGRGDRRRDAPRGSISNDRQEVVVVGDRRRRRTARKSRDDVDGDRRARKRRDSSQAAGDKELPIAEILRRSQDQTRTRYEEPTALPRLTSDTIYVQGKNGFSAVRVSSTRIARTGRRARKESTVGQDARRQRRRRRPELEERVYPHVRAAIRAQRLWGRGAIVLQGLLAGMAFLHFIMLQTFFTATLEFALQYSTLSEIYSSLFSLLVGLCVVSIFDKFDVARLDGDHLREIYGNQTRSAVAVAIYVATFALRQATARTDDWLSAMRYRHANDSLPDNDTSSEQLLQELTTWQRVTSSQDIGAVLAWFFVALGTRDDMLLMHLESMEKYANSIETN